MRFAPLVLVASLLLPALASLAEAPVTAPLASCCPMGKMDPACALRCARARAEGLPSFTTCPPPALPVGSVAAPPAVLSTLAWTATLAASEPVVPLRPAVVLDPCREPDVPPPRA